MHCIHHTIAFTDATKTLVNVEKETVADDSQFNSRSSSLTLPANSDNNDNQSSSTVRRKSLLKPAVDLTRPSISKIELTHPSTSKIAQTLSSFVGKYHVQCVIVSDLKFFLLVYFIII